MSNATLDRALADFVLITHVGFVAFVVGGLFLSLLGGFCRWLWTRNPWFRFSHLAAITLVVMQSWFGIICPLTRLEMALREQASDTTYSGTFIAHWLQRFLYFEAPPWVFTVSYTLFGILVIASWIKFPPRSFKNPLASSAIWELV